MTMRTPDSVAESNSCNRVKRFLDAAHEHLREKQKVNGYQYGTGDVLALTRLMEEDYLATRDPP